MIENYNIHTFVMAIDCGPCRFGFYAPVMERILHDIGYEVTIIPLQQSDLLTFEWLQTFYRLTSVQGKLMRNYDIIRGVRLFFAKAKYIEMINKHESLIRCREVHKGDTTKTVKQLMSMLDAENDPMALHHFDYVIKQEFAKISIKRNFQPLRIMVSGEIHVFLEHFVNMDIVRRFGEEGVEVHLGHSLYDWIIHKVHLNYKRKNLERIAKDYIPMDIGGEAVWVMGEYLKCLHEGFDGFVHVYPFTCMPEVSCRGIIEAQSPDPFYLPVQFYSFDEHTGFEGMRTRLEAFIDLMKSNREINPRFQNKYVEPPEIAELFDHPIHKATFFDNIKESVQPILKLLKLINIPKNGGDHQNPIRSEDSNAASSQFHTNPMHIEKEV